MPPDLTQPAPHCDCEQALQGMHNCSAACEKGEQVMHTGDTCHDRQQAWTDRRNMTISSPSKGAASLCTLAALCMAALAPVCGA